jgi:hypothetical protein
VSPEIWNVVVRKERKPTACTRWKAVVRDVLRRAFRTPPGSDVAADKAFLSRVKVPSSPWLDAGMSRYPSSWWVTTRPWRGVNGLAALWPGLQIGTPGGTGDHKPYPRQQLTCNRSSRGRSPLEASHLGEPDQKRMTAAPQKGGHHSSCSGAGGSSAPNRCRLRCGRCCPGRNEQAPRGSAAGYGSQHP